MSRFSSRFAPTVFIGVFASLMPSLWHPASSRSADPFAEMKIERLIDDLGSGRFETREAATQALMGREEAAFRLHQALSSPDAEVRRRAADLLVALEPKSALRGLARGRALAKEGRIVETVDRLVHWRRWDTKEEGWGALTRFVDKLIDLTGDVVPRGFPYDVNYRRTPRFPAGDFRRYAEASRPREISGGQLVITRPGIFLARGEEITCVSEPLDFTSSIIVASGTVSIPYQTAYSVLVAGDDINLRCLISAILICDGDVKLSVAAKGCIIIARGKVSCGLPGELNGCIIRSENVNQSRNDKKRIIKDGTPDFLDFVKFFELSDVGLTAADRDPEGELVRDSVCLGEVRKGSPFVGGLRAGDIVTALDGTKVASKESFRRLLRKKLAQGGPALTFTLRRSGRTMDVPLPVKD